MRVRCIRESIERLLCFSFEIFNNTDYLINTCLVDQTARVINKQANVWVKLNFRRKLHCASLNDRPPVPDANLRPNEAGAARPQRLPHTFRAIHSLGSRYAKKRQVRPKAYANWVWKSDSHGKY